MEQRASTRMPFKERVKFGNYERAYFEAFTKDISDSGIGLISFEHLPEDTKASLIVFYGHKPLNLSGKVKWVAQDTNTKQYRMGIEFDRSVKELDIIYNFLFK